MAVSQRLTPLSRVQRTPGPSLTNVRRFQEGMDKTRHGGYHGGATTMGSTPGAAMEAVRRLSGTNQRQSAVALASTSNVLA